MNNIASPDNRYFPTEEKTEKDEKKLNTEKETQPTSQKVTKVIEPGAWLCRDMQDGYDE